jgi:hypothetical protein
MKTISTLFISFLFLWTAPAWALTNGSVTLEWTKTADATIRYELQWKHFHNAWTWVSVAIDLDSTTGRYVQTFTSLPDSTGDRGACWDARAVRGSQASPWLSESNGQVCTQIPLTVAAPIPAPIPMPTPEPVPPPLPSGLTISSATPDEIVIVASAADCPRILTSTKGSTALTLKRTVRCVQ